MSYTLSHTPLTAGDEVTVLYTLNSASTVSNVETVVAIPAGTSYSLLSAVASNGTFDETDVWTVNHVGGVEDTLSLTFVIDDIDVFSGDDRDFSAVTTAADGEVIVINNTVHNVVTDTTCADLTVCGDGVFAQIGEDEEITGEWSFTDTVHGVINAYNSVTWDGSDAFVTEDAVRDVIEGLVVGAIPDGDYGDVTVSGGGTVITIDNDVVTYAKMQNISTTDRLLGRDTAGSGNTEELTVAGGVEFTGSGGIQSSAFTGDVTKAAGGTVTTVANDSITNAKLDNMATDTLKGRDTAGTGDPEDITLNVTLEFTGTGSLQRAAISNDVVIAAGSNSALIPNDTITYAKMQDVSATDKILGRVSGGSGNVEEITFTDQAQQLADDTSFSDMRTTLGLAIGSDVQAYDAGLAALAVFNTNGILVQTANNTFVGRTLTGTANEITVSQGDGVSGNPTVSLPTTIDLSGKTNLRVPVSAAPTIAVAGDLALDTTVTDLSHGVLKYYGAETLGVIAVPVAQFTGMSNGDVLVYDAAADEFTIAPVPSYGGALVYEAIISQVGTSNPTASVKMNTLGEVPTLNRDGVGDYSIDTVGTVFASGSIVQATLASNATAAIIRAGVGVGPTEIRFKTYDAADAAADLVGDLYISLRVW